MINKRVNIYDACLGRMCISLIKNLEKKNSIILSLKKIPYRFSCVSSFSWSYRSILIKFRSFFQILAGRRSSYGNQEEEISPQTRPPPHHCVLCKKSLRELAVFKHFAVLFPPFRVKILLNQSICKVSKIF